MEGTNLSEYLSGSGGRLFLAMAEELKLPLQHIARQAELHMMQAAAQDGTADLRDIRASADMSLQLLDCYLLSLRLGYQPASQLELEPVSVSAVLHDTATELRHIAGAYGVTLQVHIQNRYEPVMANRQALQSALTTLGYALIEALPSTGVPNQRLQLATHRTKQGIVAGVYGELESLTPSLFRRARQLHGDVRQPLVGTLPGSGAGLFVADAILAAMESRLRVGRHMKLPGFAVTLPTSEQLQLV
jgi:light-regulated signal transduction histidine kinase (bacteriophytochrome)